MGASWFVNSPVTGNREDFVVQELVAYVDASFRTIPTRDARGLVGHHMGAYGAIRVGMQAWSQTSETARRQGLLCDCFVAYIHVAS
jgi:S-formylglutathione hydrolase FrmB